MISIRSQLVFSSYNVKMTEKEKERGGGDRESAKKIVGF